VLNKIAVILPIRYAGEERKKRLTNAINSWEKQSEGLSDLHIIIDDDNVKVFDYLNYDKRITSITTQSVNNTLMQKINSIALETAKKYKYIAFSADDIVFETPWESKFVEYLSSVPYGIVYGNDTVHGKNLAIHPCVSSNIVNALGFFGCPAVAHNFFDNFWMAVGQETGNIKYFDEVVMKHMNPIFGIGPKDEINIKVMNLMESDEKSLLEYVEKKFTKDLEKVKNLEID
jgi:hypothetical protein